MTENLTNNQTEATGSIMDGIEPEKIETLDEINSPEASTEKTRPDNLGEDFWNDETKEVKLEELITAHKQESEKALGLRRKLSDKKSIVAPKTSDEYSIQVAEGQEAIVADDSDLMGVLREKAHDADLTTDQFNKFLGDLLPALKEEGFINEGQGEEISEEEQAQEDKEYRDAELAKLGKDAQRVVLSLKNWGDSMVNRGILSRDEKPVFEAMAHNAPSLVILNKIMSLTGEPSIPINTAVAEGSHSRAEIDAIIGSDAYKNADPTAHRKVTDFFKAANPE